MSGKSENIFLIFLNTKISEIYFYPSKFFVIKNDVKTKNIILNKYI